MPRRQVILQRSGLWTGSEGPTPHLIQFQLERFLVVAIQREGATGSQWVEAGDATEQPVVLGTAPPWKG